MRLLLLEDMVSDAELIIRTLERAGVEFVPTIVQNRIEFINALDRETYDAILADNSMPQFSASEALEIISEKKVPYPFILVTGSISEEYAVEIMKKGAWDYILKDRLQRLPSAVLSAIHKRHIESERKKYLEEVVANEILFKEAARLAHFGSWESDLANRRERWSDEQYDILGYAPGEIEPSLANFMKNIHPEDVGLVEHTLGEAFKHMTRQKYECRIIDKTGHVKHISGEMIVKGDDKGRPARINGFILDVSDRKASEHNEKKISDDLVQRNKDLEQFAYIVSHNLRGPVANIVGVSSALIDGGLTEEEQTEFMGALDSSVKKLDNMIVDLNHILQVRHHVNENKERIFFDQLVEEIKLNIGTFLDDKCIMIACDFDEVNEMFTLKSYMRSIFYNLISNSIKFRKADMAPVIEIKSAKFPDRLELTFRDNGIGIDLSRKKDQVFGLYKRFHPDHAEGKGMGLFMVKTQVETLGGKISIDSKINEGTEFRIVFNNN